MVAPSPKASNAAWSSIGLYASVVDDLERTRIALNNRVEAFVREGASREHPDVQLMLSMTAEMERVEEKAIKRLEWGMRHETPLGAWVKATHGLGLKSVGRFLGVVGNPVARPIRDATEPWPADPKTGKIPVRPILGWTERTVGQLWAYCGLDVREGKAPRRMKGVQGNWNAIARKRAYVMAEACLKQVKSPYRAVYDAARLKYEHAEIADGHKHNRAMRAMMKAIVKDIWIQTRKGVSV